MKCWHTCYYNDRFYTPGEDLLPGLPPGKYFSEDGLPPEGVQVDPTTAADDPRSTKQMRADVIALGGDPDEEMPRRQLFLLWHRLKEKTVSKTPPAPTPEAPVGLDGLTKAQLIDYGQRKFGVELNSNLTKPEIVKELGDLEQDDRLFGGGR